MGDEDRKRGRTDWVAGNTNLHFLLTFNDGGKDMLARVRFTRDSLWAWHSPVANEFETLQVVHSIIPKWSSKSWLLDGMSARTRKKGTRKKVTRSLTDSSEFIILERKEGQPWFADKYNPNWQRTVKDIAQLSVKFAKKTFTGGVGSFMPGTLVAGGQPSIGSIRLFDCGPSGYGPFQTPAQLHLDRIDLFLAGHYAHSLPIDKKSHEVYLAHLELRDLIAKNVEMNTAPPASYIKHADDKGDHWLIREDGSLSAIIDWEFTYITSFAEAFASPRPFFDEESDKHGLSSKELDLRNAYMSLGRSDLAAAVDGSAKYHLIGTIVFQPSHNTKLRRRVRRAFVGDAEGLDPASPDQWVAAAYLRYGQHHPGFQRLLNNHPMGSSWKEQLDKSLDRAAKELKGEIPVGSWNPE
jgi:hypothetical protein